MEYLKVNGTEYPAHFCGKQIDRDWDGRASKTVTLAMPYAQAVQLFVDGLRWGIVRPARMTRRRSRTAPATASQARSQTTGTGRSVLKWAAIRSWSRRCGSWRRRWHDETGTGTAHAD